jgi:hypothetical protein
MAIYGDGWQPKLWEGGSREIRRGIHKSVLERLKGGDVGLNILMPQDSVGIDVFSIGESRRCFATLQETLKNTGIHLWANCESFDFGPDNKKSPIEHLVPRFKNGGFDGAAGFVQQMETVRPYVEKITTYMLTELFTKPGFIPEIGGAPAVAQYENYSKYMLNPAPVYKNLAKGKKYVKTLEANVEYSDDGSFKATDGLFAGSVLDDGRRWELRESARDINMAFGYYLARINDTVEVSVIIDLESEYSIDMVRTAECWVSSYSADMLTIELSKDGNDYSRIGSETKKLQGWISVVFAKPEIARFVKVTFYKKSLSDKDWLFIDEIEVCARVMSRKNDIN